MNSHQAALFSGGTFLAALLLCENAILLIVLASPVAPSSTTASDDSTTSTRLTGNADTVAYGVAPHGLLDSPAASFDVSQVPVGLGDAALQLGDAALAIDDPVWSGLWSGIAESDGVDATTPDNFPLKMEDLRVISEVGGIMPIRGEF